MTSDDRKHLIYMVFILFLLLKPVQKSKPNQEITTTVAWVSI